MQRNTLLKMPLSETQLHAPPTRYEADAHASLVHRQTDMAELHYQFIWRSLRRLGVMEQGVDDATQEVFLIAAEKIACIRPGCERSFLFQTAVNVAMAVRRRFAQRREDVGGEPLDYLADSAPLPDAVIDARQRRKHLDAVLTAMSMELRAAFVLYELEGMSSPDIAVLLQVPVGTVASRLRRARAIFEKQAARMRRLLQRNVKP